MGRHVKRTRRGGILPVLLLLLVLLAVILLLKGRLQPSPAAAPDGEAVATRNTVKPAVQTLAPETPAPTPEPTPTPAPTPTPTPWNLTLVNRTHPVPADWEIQPVEMPNGQIVDARIYDPLMDMFEAARSVNMDMLPNVESGYRTQEKQEEIYYSRIREYMAQGWSEAGARAETEKWVSIPGTSEHQLGIAVDISGAVYAIYGWLQENSWQFGFILRYPPDKTDITGVSGEEWHYRYVGIEAATEIHERGITLEEYLAESEESKAVPNPQASP